MGTGGYHGGGQLFQTSCPQLMSPPTFQLHKQQAQAEPERHVWHRRESDESGESAPEEGGEGSRAPQPIPRSASYPCATPRPGAPETTALQGGFQRRYGGITGIQWRFRRSQSLGGRVALSEASWGGKRSEQSGPKRLTLTSTPHRTFLHISVWVNSKGMFSFVSRSWHSTPGSLSLLSAAPWRVG